MNFDAPRDCKWAHPLDLCDIRSNVITGFDKHLARPMGNPGGAKKIGSFLEPTPPRATMKNNFLQFVHMFAAFWVN